MKKIKEIFEKLDLKKNPSTVLAIILEFILLSDIIIAVISGEVSLLGYILIVIIAMMYVAESEYNLRRYLNLKDKK